MKLSSKMCSPIILGFIVVLIESACTDLIAHQAKTKIDDIAPEVVTRTLDCNYPVVNLAYLEFTDDGNLFSDSSIEVIKDYLDRSSKLEEKMYNIAVYVHGWHHGAKSDDLDLIDFKNLIGKLSCMPGFNQRQTIGIYVGWRGQSLRPKVLNYLAYWARKSKAETIGRRRFASTILELEESARSSGDVFFVIGHSFGTALALSGLDSILRDRLISAAKCNQTEKTEMKCNTLPRFGHGMYLFNPAIEANALLPIKSYLTRTEYLVDQPKLLHILTTRSDTPTKVYFRIGQNSLLNWLRSDKDDIKVGDLIFDEKDLMHTTMGQFPPFWNGSISSLKKDGATVPELYHHIKADCESVMLPKGTYPDSGWIEIESDESQTIICSQGDSQKWGAYEAHKIKNHVFSNANDPVQVTVADWFTDSGSGFMENHNAHLCPNPFGYIATAVMENQFALESRVSSSHTSNIPQDCLAANGSFDFPSCFTYFRKQFSMQTYNSSRCGDQLNIAEVGSE